MKNTKQDNNIIKLIRANAGRIWVDGGTYPHYKNKLGKLSAGFEVVALENGKPSTIQAQADPNANNYLFVFVSKQTQRHNGGRVWFSCGYKNFLFLTKWENGHAKALEWISRNNKKTATIGVVYRCSDAENIRKVGDRFYLLKVAPQYSELDREKQRERAQNWRNLSTSEKAHEEEKNIIDKKPTFIERLSGARFVAYTGRYYSHSYILLDACYNDLTTNREMLKQRTKALHEKRQRTEWANQDHTDTVRELEKMCDTFAHTITDILNAKKYDFYAREIIDCLISSIEHAQETIERVKSCEISTVEQLNERIKKDRLNAKKCRLIAIKQGEPKLYGWNWWDNDPNTGGLVNTYKTKQADPNNEYYHFINAQGVASY